MPPKDSESGTKTESREGVRKVHRGTTHLGGGKKEEERAQKKEVNLGKLLHGGVGGRKKMREENYEGR